MKILCIDTTKKAANIFISDGDKEFFATMNPNVKHSEGLFLYIEKLLFESKTSIDDFDYFACNVGPGSFTGIRVGMSVIKGFNRVKNKKIIPFNSFELFVPIVKDGLVLLSSTSTSCYFAVIEHKKILNYGVKNKSEIAEFAGDKKIFILKEEQSDFEFEYNNKEIISDLQKLYKQIIMEKIDKNISEEFLPYYLQLSQAERNLKSESN